MNRNEWYLKANDETFGPETRDRLVEWAKMGRILPGQELSIDGTRWFAVTDVPFLDMRWSIDIGDGNPRGPFNKAAADALLKSGRLPRTAFLVESREPFGDAPFPPPEEEPAPAPAAASAGPAAPAEPATPAPEMAAAAPDDSAERAAIDAERAKLASEKAAFDAERAGLESERAALEAERTKLGQGRRELEAELARAKAEAAESLAKARADAAAELEKAKAEASAKLEETRAGAELAEKNLGLELERLGRDFNEASAKLRAAEARADDLERQLADTVADREKQLALADTRLRGARADAAAAIEAGAKQHAADAAAIADANDRAEIAAKRVADAERQYADLLEQSNRREKEYQTRIARLGDELQRVPPDSAAAAAATAAIFELMQMEADDIARTLEQEKRDAENARQVWLKREDRLLARRQELLKKIGDGPSNMLKRAVGDHPDDAKTVLLRQELDKVKQVNEQMMRAAERREQEANEKIKRYEAENSRLRNASTSGTLASAQIQQLKETLVQREKEIVELRQNVAKAERARAVMEQTMQARINTMESAPFLPNIETTQSREAKHVKLASWMRLRS